MARITIDGRTFDGNSVSIINGRVVVDGKEQGAVHGVVKIQITEGALGSLTTDASVECLNIQGNVSARGSVKCHGVRGNVDAGGSVTVGGRR